jgi:hypothetical protein
VLTGVAATLAEIVFAVFTLPSRHARTPVQARGHNRQAGIADGIVFARLVGGTFVDIVGAVITLPAGSAITLIHVQRDGCSFIGRVGAAGAVLAWGTQALVDILCAVFTSHTAGTIAFVHTRGNIRHIL